MKNQPIFNWDEVNKTATCIITDNNNIFYGIAICHPEDEDMCSEKTGYEIAFNRASIKAYKHYKNCLNERLSGLNQLYYSMNRSKNFKAKSYENIMLQRQIKNIKQDLVEIKDLIKETEGNLRKYLKDKDVFYNKVRENRNKKIKDKDK